MTNSSGSVYRQYVYDPYGNIISVKDGSGNPINITNDTGFNNAYTYRGYRFDSETGLYFLQSRYYSPGIGELAMVQNQYIILMGGMGRIITQMFPNLLDHEHATCLIITITTVILKQGVNLTI